ARRPRSATSRAVPRAPSSSECQVTPTSNPSSARATAAARPIPESEPVTTAEAMRRRVPAPWRRQTGLPPAELRLELLEPPEGVLVEVAERVTMPRVTLDSVHRKGRRPGPPALRPRALRRQGGQSARACARGRA